MELFFDPLLREYVIQLKGMLRYNTPIGSDVHGNITRLDNTIDGISKRLKLAVFELENTEKQLENAKESAAKPFPQEEELKAKTERLNELNAPPPAAFTRITPGTISAAQLAAIPLI